MKKTKNFIPNPRYILSLRESGYNNYQAIEDIVDNSVDALKDVSEPFIIISTRYSNTDYYNGKIIISDNGCGMDKETLHEALKLGSETNKSQFGDDLGRFGTGLKASAISIGKMFKIITKSKNDGYLTAIYDIDEAVKNNTWDFPIIKESTEEEITTLKSYGIKNTGTYLEICKLDQISNKNSTNFSNTLIKKIAETFRYKISIIDNDGLINFFINDKKVKPIDPMCRDYKNTILLNNEDDNKYKINIDGKDITFYMDFYHIDDNINDGLPITPNLKNQGIYVVRNDRQIMRSKTLGLFLRDPWLNNFRVELRYDSIDDDYFKIDIKKIVINPLQSILDKIEQDVNLWRLESRKIRKLKNIENKKIKDSDKLNELIEKKQSSNPHVPKYVNDEIPVDNDFDKLENIDNNDKINDIKNSKDRKISASKSKLPYSFETYDGDDRSRFFKYKKSGAKKYTIELNVNHNFYDKFIGLNDDAQKLITDLLYSVVLAQDKVLYDILGTINEFKGEIDYDDKYTFINDFDDSWSDYLKNTIN